MILGRTSRPPSAVSTPTRLPPKRFVLCILNLHRMYIAIWHNDNRTLGVAEKNILLLEKKHLDIL